MKKVTQNDTKKYSKFTIKAHGISALKSAHPAAQKLKRQGHIPELHGNKVWASCYVLMDYLKKHPIPNKSSTLDIGCGWGVLSTFLAKKFDAKVTGADADKNVQPFFELTAELNKVNTQFMHKRFEQLTGKILSDYQILVGSDICFWDEMTDLLYKLIRRASKNGVQEIYIADPGRSPFLELAEKCQKHWNAELITHTTKTPKNSTKDILVIRM